MKRSLPLIGLFLVCYLILSGCTNNCSVSNGKQGCDISCELDIDCKADPCAEACININEHYDTGNKLLDCRLPEDFEGCKCVENTCQMQTTSK